MRAAVSDVTRDSISHLKKMSSSHDPNFLGLRKDLGNTRNVLATINLMN